MIMPISVSFGYRHRLKTEWLEGNIPQLKHDFYDGSLLDPKTVTIEHLLPHSKGGKTTLTNIVLTSYQNNVKRGNRDIRQYINKEAAKKYIEEARQIKAKGLNGEYYVEGLVKRLKKLGVNLDITI